MDAGWGKVVCVCVSLDAFEVYLCLCVSVCACVHGWEWAHTTSDLSISILQWGDCEAASVPDKNASSLGSTEQEPCLSLAPAPYLTLFFFLLHTFTLHLYVFSLILTFPPLKLRTSKLAVKSNQKSELGSLEALFLIINKCIYSRFKLYKRSWYLQ